MPRTRAARKPLTGKVAVVAGATRGAGRGIACALGEAGATVYCTGRTTRASVKARPREHLTGHAAFRLSARRECIEDTAAQVSALGGEGIAVRADHTVEREVLALFRRIEKRHGHVDVLVNDVWGGEELVAWGKPVWELSMDDARALLERAVLTHLITSRHGLPLMLDRKAGLVVEVTDALDFGYRGQFLYDLVKSTVNRMAFGLSEELRPRGIAAVAVSPGFLRSEAMLDHFGVTEETWRDAGKQDVHFLKSESPRYVGRAVAALAADPDVMRLSGRVVTSGQLAPIYGFTDLDGTRPPFMAEYFAHCSDKPVRGMIAEARRSHERFRAAFDAPPRRRVSRGGGGKRRAR